MYLLIENQFLQLIRTFNHLLQIDHTPVHMLGRLYTGQTRLAGTRELHQTGKSLDRFGSCDDQSHIIFQLQQVLWTPPPTKITVLNTDLTHKEDVLFNFSSSSFIVHNSVTFQFQLVSIRNFYLQNDLQTRGRCQCQRWDGGGQRYSDNMRTSHK